MNLRLGGRQSEATRTLFVLGKGYWMVETLKFPIHGFLVLPFGSVLILNEKVLIDIVPTGSGPFGSSV